jgi:hypothetical protein
MNPEIVEGCDRVISSSTDPVFNEAATDGGSMAAITITTSPTRLCALPTLSEDSHA